MRSRLGELFLQLFFQLPNDPFFKAGDIALADAEGVGGFFLGALHAVHKAEAQFHDLPLPRGEQRDRLAERGPLGVLFEPLADQIFVAAEDVGEEKLVAVAVHVEGLVDAGLLAAVGTFA